MNLSDDLLSEIVLKYNCFNIIPRLMFTRKALRSLNYNHKVIQKYLAWKYKVSGVDEIQYHPHLLHLEGLKYAKLEVDVSVERSAKDLEVLIAKNYSIMNRSVVDDLLLALYDLAICT